MQALEPVSPGLGSALLMPSSVGVIMVWASGNLVCSPPHVGLWSPH